MSGPYDQQVAFSQGYDHNNQYYNQNSYPSEGFSGSYQPQTYHNSQSYYPDTRGSSYPDNTYQQGGSNTSYYNNSNTTTTTNPQGAEADRGLLGAAAGGAAGAFGGHKAGHGVLGAIGGAILGSLTEDYAKKHRKHDNRQSRHNRHNHGHRDDSSSYAGGNSQNFASGGLGSVASSFFNKK
ncbi:hypothetical protein AYL99_06325 [Fonsecaea erecta]|uniref:Glycine zipper 2TM domain-containing protein n=1 Tax=Fonsecaea erecta TaxID=1367422 RepID=A0A178ZGW7_9EURO|nr:hypothetical protein AYL99_06325 [Fonsecaea erecta]OAP59028.1 hypothetical protein AYL99_06325 [Fonsecaea erecta]